MVFAPKIHLSKFMTPEWGESPHFRTWTETGPKNHFLSKKTPILTHPLPQGFGASKVPKTG